MLWTADSMDRPLFDYSEVAVGRASGCQDGHLEPRQQRFDMEVRLTTVPPAHRTTGPGSDRAADFRPDTGKTLPQTGRLPPSPPLAEIKKVIKHIQSLLANSGRKLSFRIDSGSGRTVITVINPATNEVIRQIPSEEVLRLAAVMRSQGFHTFSDRA